MKKLLSTTLVFAIIVSMLCVTPAVMAAETPTMSLEVLNYNSSDDIVNVTLDNVSGATWVVLSVLNTSTNDYILFDEKRGNIAERDGFTIILPTEEKPSLDGDTFSVEVNITGDNGTTPLPPKSFTYYTYDDAQIILRDMLAGANGETIASAQEKLLFKLPDYYSNTLDATILAALNLRPAISSVLSANGGIYNAGIPATHFTLTGGSSIYAEMNDAILDAAMNSGNATLISSIIDNSADVGIASFDSDKMIYNASPNKNAIASKLATYTYATSVDFANQFRTVTFLDKVSATGTTGIIDLLKANDNTYTNYGSQTTNLTGGTPADFLFDTASGYDALANTQTKIEYAGNYLAGSYENMDALLNKFNTLLTLLPSVLAPSPVLPTPDPGPSGNSGPSVSVGLVNPIVGQNSPFMDLGGVEWAKPAIIALANEGVINGVAPNQFYPNANITREEFVKIVVNTYKLAGTGKGAAFNDVNQNEWYAPYINTAVELGIINGVSDSSFGVGQNVTRQDMTVILYRIAKYLGYNLTAKSSRVLSDMGEIDSYAVEAVTTLYKAELVNGLADGYFGGWQYATRAQAAKLSYDIRESN